MRRAVLVAATAACLLLAGPGAAAAVPAPPGAPPDAPAPGGCTGTFWTPVCAAKGAAGGVAASAANATLLAMANWVGEAARWFLGRVAELLDGSTRPDGLRQGWFMGHYNVMFGLAGALLLPLLFLAVIRAVLRMDWRQLAHSVAAVPLAFVLSAAAVTVITGLLALSDGMSAAVTGTIGRDAQTFFAAVGQWFVVGAAAGAATGHPDVPLFAVFVAAVMTVLGAFILWVELVLRAGAIYVAALFLPLAFAGLVWPSTQHLARRLVHVLVALIFSKFVIVAIISLCASGLAELGGLDDDHGFAAVLAMTGMLLIAVYSPFALLAALPGMEEAVRSAAGHRQTIRQAVPGVAAVPSFNQVLTRMRDSRAREERYASQAARGHAARQAPAPATTQHHTIAVIHRSEAGDPAPDGRQPPPGRPGRP